MREAKEATKQAERDAKKKTRDAEREAKRVAKAAQKDVDKARRKAERLERKVKGGVKTVDMSGVRAKSTQAATALDLNEAADEALANVVSSQDHGEPKPYPEGGA